MKSRFSWDQGKVFRATIVFAVLVALVLGATSCGSDAEAPSEGEATLAIEHFQYH